LKIQKYTHLVECRKERKKKGIIEDWGREEEKK